MMKNIYLTLLALYIIFPFNMYSQSIFKYATDGNIDSARILIEKDATLLEAKDNNGKTALSFAALKGHFEIVEYLIEKGADVNTQNNFGTTPLHYASFYNFPEIVHVLIENKAQLNLHSDFTATPISFAATKGNTDIVKMLIESGADVNIPDKGNKSPLYFAVGEGHLESVKLLLNAGAYKSVITQNGENILHATCKSGIKDIVDLFIDLKDGFKKMDNYGNTPLFYAIQNGSAEVINIILLKINPGLSIKSNDGNTYLHAAAEGGLKDFARKCIESGIDINSTNVFGLTPLDLAEKNGKSELADFLKQHGAISRRSIKYKGSYVDNNNPGFIPVLFAPGDISTPDSNERDVTFTPGGSEIYFTRWTVDNRWNIMIMKKRNGIWSDPQKASIASDYLDAEACVTSDGNKIYFISNRPRNAESPAGAWGIWFSVRENDNWEKPNLLGDKFKGGFYPTFTKDGTLYFTNASNDISKSLLVDGEYKEIINLGDSVNTPQAEYNSLIAPDESYLIFTTKGRGEGYGNDDLYICFHNEDGTWTTAKNMGPVINSFAREYCPALSYDGKYFFFCSSRYGTEDIYWVDAKIIKELRPKE